MQANRIILHTVHITKDKGTYYPFVTSRENDYASSAGKPIQLLSLYAYKMTGTKLVTGVVVMYRAYVEGRWLPWVKVMQIRNG